MRFYVAAAELMKVPVSSSRVPTKAGRVAPTQQKTNPFYQSAEWIALVAEVLLDRGRRCQECGRTHNIDKTPIRVFLDHIIELRDGGAKLDKNNLKVLCGMCHSRKTMRERAKRAAAHY